MAPSWSRGHLIDLTEDDTTAQQSTTRSSIAGSAPRAAQMLSTTTILPPPQPAWATLASSTPILPPARPNFDTTIPNAKRQKVKHDTSRKVSGNRLTSETKQSVASPPPQRPLPATCSPVPIPQAIFGSSPNIRPSIETPDNGFFQANSTNLHVRSSTDYDSTHNGSPHAPISEPTQNRQPSPQRLLRKKPVRNTKQLQKARERAVKWQGGRACEPSTSTPERTPNSTFGIAHRPYLSGSQRRDVAAGMTFGADPSSEESKIKSHVLHVDFTDSENRYLRNLARLCYGRLATGGRPPLRDLRHLLKKDKDKKVLNGIINIVQKKYEGYATPPINLLCRGVPDIENYLTDLVTRRHNVAPQVLRLELERPRMPVNRVPHLLYARETAGRRGFGSLRQYQDFNTCFKSYTEDYLEPRIEFTNCAGDVMTICWLSDNQFICGATTHSDSHNQQYNKPGNLALGNVSKKKLVAYADHRIVRPVISHGANALNSMRESQDPWLFTSVVNSDYSITRKVAFTCSFDNTVKVWQPEEDGMHIVGTWPHMGRVQHVVASTAVNGYQMVATGADIADNAVRVYYLSTPSEDYLHLESQLRSQLENHSRMGMTADDDQPGAVADAYSQLPYKEYSCSRISEDGFTPSEKWAYYPASISWGKAPGCEHFLLVGYSPRPQEGYTDADIPEDKIKTGELCVFDTLNNERIKVTGAAMQNVFEVVWHPFFACFAASTSTALGIDGRATSDARTQIRTFVFDKGVFSARKVMDCPAADINKLTMKPNSKSSSYITASCTNSRVYVWDTAADTDRPMCVLKHGDPIDEIFADREQEDVGVTFTAWGSTPDRLYTGASDGVVKVWNIRQGRGELVRDLVELQGPITAGAFSRDLKKLAVGDGTGKVCIMTHDEEDDEPALSGSTIHIHGTQRAIRRPRPIQPHPEVPAPKSHGTLAMSPEPEDGPEIGARWLRKQELVLKPGLGVFQGPNYSNIGLYRNEFHLDEDPAGPLLAEHQAKQQTDRLPGFWPTRRQRSIVFPNATSDIGRTNFTKSTDQLQQDFAGLDLDPATEAQLKADRVEYDPRKVDYVFLHEDFVNLQGDNSEDEDEDESMDSSSSEEVDGDNNDEDTSSDEEDDEVVEISSRPIPISKPLVQSAMGSWRSPS